MYCLKYDIKLKLYLSACHVQILVLPCSIFSANRNTAALCHLLEGGNEVNMDSRLAELLNNVQHLCYSPCSRLSCVAS